MTEAEWLACCELGDLCEHIEPITSARKMRLLGCACVCWAWTWGLQEPPPDAIEAVEAFADGQAKVSDLRRIAVGMRSIWRNSDEPYRPYPRTCELTELLASPTNERGWLAEIYPFASDMNIIEEPEWQNLAAFAHDIFGNPFRRVRGSPLWQTSTTLTLARTMYEARDFAALPILGDALQDAGCDDETVIAHCGHPGPHVRGCWVIDLVLGKE